MLDWWRPLKFKKENIDDFWFDKKSTMFDMYSVQDNELSPIIIGCNNKRKTYYLVVTRFAICDNRFNGKEELLKANENEILITMTKNGFIYYDWYYVNCGRIFEIKCSDLETIVDNSNDWSDNYERIWDQSIYNVIDKIKENIFEKEPMFSIIGVNLDYFKKVYYETFYLNKKMLDKIIKRIGNSRVIVDKYDAIDLNYNSLVDMEKYATKVEKTQGWEKELGEYEISFSYRQAINFCEYFLKEYCEWNVKKFLDKQNI